MPGVARLYGAIAYAASLALILLAAMLTATRARDAFIFIFLPGVLLAVLTPFIWSGSRSAMLLALAVSVVLQIMVAGGGSLDWRLFLPMPAAFTALTIAALASANRSVEPAAGGGVLAEYSPRRSISPASSRCSWRHSALFAAAGLAGGSCSMR